MRLPSAPLLAVFERAALRQDCGLEALAESIGMSSRWFYRVRDEGWVELDMADRVACALGLLPILIWPAEYNEWLAGEPPKAEPHQQSFDEKRQRLRARIAAGDPTVRHGRVYTYYTGGCRCALCKESKREADAKYGHVRTGRKRLHPGSCTQAGCEAQSYARGWCKRHYKALWRKERAA